MAATTLVEFASLSQPKLRGAVLNTLVKNVPLMDRIKWDNTKNLTQVVTYISGIPTPAFRSLNEAPSEVKPTFAQVQETLKILEVDIIVDPVLLMLDSIQNIEAANANATVKAVGYFVNDMLINGNDSSDEEQPRGIDIRLRDDERFAGQTIDAGNGTTTELVLNRASGTDANRYAYLDHIDDLIGVMGGVNFGESAGLTFLLNAQLEQLNWSIARRLKILDTTQDQFDRTLTAFRGVPFVDVGFKPAGAVTGTFDATATAGNQIIGNDTATHTDANDPNGDAVKAGTLNYANCTSLYAVRFDMDSFMGLQVAPLRVRNLGESVDNPHKSKVNLRWVFGFGALQKRSLGRIIGLDVTS